MLGNDILYGEWHAYNQFKSQVTNCYWRKVAAPLRWIANFLFPWFVYSNNLKFHIQIHFHSPLKGWFTLHSPFFNSPLSTIHPSKGWFTLLEGDSPLPKGDSPSRVNAFTLFEGWIFFWEIHSPFEKGDSPLKRVNGRVNRVNHPSKGEWGFARYTLAIFSYNFRLDQTQMIPKMAKNV